MSKTKLAIFSATTTTPAGTEALLNIVVGFPTGKKTFGHWVLEADPATGNNVLFRTFVEGTGRFVDPPADDPNLVTLVGEALSIHPTRVNSKEIVIKSKIDRGILPLFADSFIPMGMEETELGNSAVTLKDYLLDKFTIAEDANFEDGLSKSAVAPFCFGRRAIDGLEFFESPMLSPEEKAAATAHVPLHLLKVLWELPSFQYALRQVTTRHGRPWVAIGMHGVAGGGKSLIAQALAVLLGIGFDQHNGSPQLAMTDIWGKTLPSAEEPMLNPYEVGTGKALDAAKAAYEALVAAGASLEEQDAALQRWERLKTATKREVNLVRVETTALKAAKYDLPCIVNVDELDLCNGMLLNELFATITSGTYRDGVTTGQNHGTLFWVFSWNPNTAGSKAFDQKVYDRLGMISVPPMEASIIDNAQNAALLQESELEDQPLDFSLADAIVDGAPLDEAHREALRASVHAQFGTAEDLAWFAQTRLDLMVPPTTVSVTDGVFNSVHRGQMAEDAKDVALGKLNAIDAFVEVVNGELKAATRGKDKKNPDRSAAYYIPTRAKALFKDMVLCYRDVRKGTEEFIFNLLPGCNVLSTDTKVDPAADGTPRRLAVEICEKLTDQINELNTKLFTSIDESVATAAQEAWLSAVFTEADWTVEGGDDMIANPEIIDSTPAAPAASDELDELYHS